MPSWPIDEAFLSVSVCLLAKICGFSFLEMKFTPLRQVWVKERETFTTPWLALFLCLDSFPYIFFLVASYIVHIFSAFDKWPRHNSGNNISSPYTFMMNLQIIAVEVWSNMCLLTSGIVLHSSDGWRNRYNGKQALTFQEESDDGWSVGADVSDEIVGIWPNCGLKTISPKKLK